MTSGLATEPSVGSRVRKCAPNSTNPTSWTLYVFLQHEVLSLSVNASNRITNSGFSYDAAGNLLADGSYTYQWDAENRMKSLNTTGATYTYDAEGLRVRKQVGSASTEYIYFGGQMIAERAANGDWSDYIYAGGRLLARADSYEDRIRIWGNACSNCGWQWYQFDFPDAAGLVGYVVQAGDKLHWRQWQNLTAFGGLNIRFADGSETYGVTFDQDGQDMNSDTYHQVWHYRRVDLSGHAGKTIAQVRLSVSGSTQAGFWDLYYQDIALVSADGTVRPVYNRQKTITLSGFGSSGMTGVGYEVNHVSGTGQWPEVGTNYYHGDYLGSARLMSSYNGYPVWSATYLPFGQEHNPQITVNNYKFTGLERDAESALDHTWFRQYSSAYGRWCSADPLGGSTTDPQSLNRYAYVLNDPVNFTDPQGLDCQIVGGVTLHFNDQTLTTIYLRCAGSPALGSLGAHELFGDDLDFRLEDGEVEGPGGGSVPIHSQLELFFQSARLPGETFSACFNRTQRALLGEKGANILHAVSGVSLVLFAGSASPGTQLAPTGTSTPGPTYFHGKVIHTNAVPKPSAFEKVLTLRNPPLTGTLRGFFAGVAKVTGITTAAGIGLELGFLAACR